MTRENEPVGFVPAFKTGNDIFMLQMLFIPNISYYLHEAGHDIGDELSFKNRQILTPDEIRNTKIPLSWIQKMIIYRRMMAKDDHYMDSFERTLGDGLIAALTKGNFDPGRYRVIPTTEEEVRRIAREEWSENLMIQVATGFIGISSQWGRNEEISAFVTQVGGMNILSNSIRNPLVEFIYKPGETGGSHKRAQNIALTAYRLGRVLPSSLDMMNDKKTGERTG